MPGGGVGVSTRVATTTIEEWAKKVSEETERHLPLIALLKKKGREMKLSGGRNIVRPLAYQENGTYTRFSGYGTLNNQAVNAPCIMAAIWACA